MLHLDQFKHIEVSLHGKIRKNKLYFCSCDRCGANKGYKPKSYKAQLCNRCAQSNFEPWMNWDNYGKWEIDHIIPDSSFNYSSVYDDAFKKSWTLENLQPLEKSANASKGAKICLKA